MGAAIRGDIMADWGRSFGFTQTELGNITGMGLAGFGVTIIVFSFFADVVGYGKLMIVAFLLHVAAVATTLAAPFAYKAYGKDGAYLCLYLGQIFFSLGNGTCEAVINPLTASLFPNRKTHWLNILHAGWPGGLVLGALVGFVCNKLNETGNFEHIGWQIRWGIVLAPILLYGLMMVGRSFPKSEAKLSGVKLRDMMAVVGFLGTAVVTALLGVWLTRDIVPSLNKLDAMQNMQIPAWAGWAAAIAFWLAYGAIEGFSPGHILLTFLYVLHAMIGFVELGTDNWIQDITKSVLANEGKNISLMAFMWTNILMFTLRFFAGPIVERISPLGLLFCSAVIGSAGLFLLGLPATNTMWLWLGAVTIYGIGKTFYWPTMLGVISERYPKGGALALGFSGGIGMLSAGLLGAPIIGYMQDYSATKFIQEKSPAAYNLYKSDDAPPPPLPDLEKIAGLDNAKIGILNDDGKNLQSDVNLLKKENKTDENIEKLEKWWKVDPNAEATANADKPIVNDAVRVGGKQALTWTAAVPAAMAVGFLLLIIYFKLFVRGGYRQVHINEERR